MQLTVDPASLIVSLFEFFFSHLYQTSNVFVNNTDGLTFFAPGILYFTQVFKGFTLL